jgi:hypothetical protein
MLFFFFPKMENRNIKGHPFRGVGISVRQEGIGKGVAG